MSERRRRLQEVIRLAVEQQAASIYTSIPGKVVKWDASNQRANVQVLVKEPDEDEEGNRVVKSIPVVTGVPVLMDGASNYRTTYPISDGNTTIDEAVAAATTGWLMFSHRSLDKWLTGSGDEVDPEFDHFHAPNDCFFIPGAKPFGAPWSDVPTDHMSIGKDGHADVQVHLFGDKGVLGDTGTAQYMMLTEDFFTDFKALLTTINAILLGGTIGGPTAQQIQQAAQFALSTMYVKLQAGTNPYLSLKWKNK